MLNYVNLTSSHTNCAPSHTNDCALIPSVLFDLDIVRRSRNKPKTGLDASLIDVLPSSSIERGLWCALLYALALCWQLG